MNCKSCGYKVDRYSPETDFCSCACKSAFAVGKKYPLHKYSDQAELSKAFGKIWNFASYQSVSHKTPRFEAETGGNDELSFSNGISMSQFKITRQEGDLTVYEPLYQILVSQGGTMPDEWN